LNDFPDSDIKATQARLNDAYDAFTAKYGLINDKKNARLFEDDSSYYLLCSLENLDENKQLKSKADYKQKQGGAAAMANAGEVKADAGPGADSEDASVAADADIPKEQDLF
jgi:hypothetical protein